MEFEKYEVRVFNNYLTYRFVSTGNNGDVLKVVKFEAIPYLGENFYNLALGDQDIKTREIDYKTKTKNGDRDKIFATVANIIADFLTKYPSYVVYIRGNEAYKTRAYGIVLKNILDEHTGQYEIKGIISNKEAQEAITNDDNLETEEIEFDKKRKDYIAYLIRKKNK